MWSTKVNTFTTLIYSEKVTDKLVGCVYRVNNSFFKISDKSFFVDTLILSTLFNLQRPCHVFGRGSKFFGAWSYCDFFHSSTVRCHLYYLLHIAEFLVLFICNFLPGSDCFFKVYFKNCRWTWVFVFVFF